MISPLLGLREDAVGGNELGIDDDAMMLLVGRLHHELGDRTAGLAHLVDKAALLRDRHGLVGGIGHQHEA